MSEIREFIHAILNEAIRSDMFKFNEFKKLNSIKSMKDYAFRYLEELGNGAGRHVFLLSSKKVLKIAINNFGIKQNKAEVIASSDPRARSIIAPVREHDLEFKWLTADLVKEFKDPDEIYDALGMYNSTHENKDLIFGDFIDDVLGIDTRTDDGLSDPLTVEQLLIKYFDHHHPNNKNLKPFIESLQYIVKTMKLRYGDLTRYEHFGLSREGKVTLLDYGYVDD